MEENKALKRYAARVGYTDEEVEQIREGDPRLRLIERLGQVAAHYLLDQLGSANAPTVLRQKLPARLVVRASAAPPPEAVSAVNAGQLRPATRGKSQLN